MGAEQPAGADADQLTFGASPQGAAPVRRPSAGSAPAAKRPVVRRPLPAERLPVARVAVDVPLAHLDRTFDYLVPAALDADATSGVRVRVRFAGQLVGGFLIERAEASEHTGRLAFLDRVVSPEPVLTGEVARLARAVADRWAGTLADVLRLAVPPRHARVEAEPPPDPAGGPEPAPPGAPDPASTSPPIWAGLPDGAAFAAALRRGAAPRAVCTLPPGANWAGVLASAISATLASGRGALVVVPDVRDVIALDAACTAALGSGRHVALTADLGPAKRYRRWLAVRRAQVKAVIGTRAAAFAPVADLGLVGIWDDGDDLHAEPRAPYPHIREVLTLRAHLAGTAALVAGFSRTAEAALLVASGWARDLRPGRPLLRATAPRVLAVGDDAELARDPAARAARIPSLAWRVAHDALAYGPVLVQAPRRGYLPALACVICRAPARCAACAGPLAAASSAATPVCRWCGRPAARWRCPACHGDRLRALVVGSARTAEELGRAFPAVPVRTSAQGAVLAAVPATPALVVATPGAEPVATGGYAAAVLLDGWALLARADLRAGEEALRRWANAAALVRPADAGGRVVICADAGLRPVQALVRWDLAGHAERELADREALHFPPAAHVAELSGPAAAIADLVSEARAAGLPPSAQLLGPVPGTDDEPQRLLVRVPRPDRPVLTAALRSAQGVRSARKSPGAVRVRIDPVDLG